MSHHRPHRSHQVSADLEHFWAVTCLSNSPRYRKRYENYWHFADMCKGAGVRLITVEIAFGHRPFMITEAGNPHHVQLRSHEELWHKENMLDLGAKRAAELDPLAREIAFIDSDIRPMGHPRHWFEETWHALQHFEVVQMAEYLLDLDSENNPIGSPQPSFMSSYMKGLANIPALQPNAYVKPQAPWLGWPGGCWAWNIDAFRHVGGLLDSCVLGSGDFHMAQGLVGLLEPGTDEKWSTQYSKYLFNWQERALRWLKKDVGVVRGGILHDNHGPKKNRFYVSRKQILVESEYDPNVDVKYDHQGLLQLETWSERQMKLRDDIRNYFRSRLEDMQEFRQ